MSTEKQFKNEEGTGVLFVSNASSKTDYFGAMTLNGLELELSAWQKTTKKNERWMSGTAWDKNVAYEDRKIVTPKVKKKEFVLANNTWNLHRNNNKKSDGSPDYFGTLKIAEKEYKLVGWIKISKSQKPRLELVLNNQFVKMTEEEKTSAISSFEDVGNGVEESTKSL